MPVHRVGYRQRGVDLKCDDHPVRASRSHITATQRRILRRPPPSAAPRRHAEDTAMSKGMDQKKEQKKKPAKTAKEKKAEKRDKKTAKGFAPV